MRFRMTALMAAAIFLFSIPAPGQTPARNHGAKPLSEFEPLEKWKAAVLSGDKTVLTAMYSTAPAASAKTPKGTSTDPMEEPEFWAGLKAAGLESLDVKLFEIESPRPGVQDLVLHIEGDMRSGAGTQRIVFSSLAQGWVRQGDNWRIAITRRGDPRPYTVRSLMLPAKTNPHLYPEPDEAQADLNATLVAAARDRKRVIVVFGANWCYDCHVLDAAFRSKDIAPLVEASYHVVHISVGDEGDLNKDLAQRFGVPLERGIPALAVLEGDGTLVVSQQQGEFENSTRIGPQDVVSFLNQWKPERKM